MMKLRAMAVAAVSAACALFGASAHAQAPQLMSDFSIAEMRAVLTEVGVKIEREDTTTEGDRYLVATDTSGLKFNVYAYECDANQRCRGADYVVSFTIKAGKIKEALEKVSFAAVADYEVDGGDLQMSRYVIFDGGITRANLLMNTNVFIDLSNDSWDALDEAELLR